MITLVNNPKTVARLRWRAQRRSPVPSTDWGGARPGRGRAVSLPHLARVGRPSARDAVLAAAARRHRSGDAQADARRVGHQVAGDRDLGVLFGRLHRLAEGRSHHDRDRVGRPPHSPSAADPTSDFTYFAKAYFDEALRGTYSFQAAFDQARRASTRASAPRAARRPIRRSMWAPPWKPSCAG